MNYNKYKIDLYLAVERDPHRRDAILLYQDNDRELIGVADTARKENDIVYTVGEYFYWELGEAFDIREEIGNFQKETFEAIGYEENGELYLFAERGKNNE